MDDSDRDKGLAGRFLVLDGPDGCGKSSQARMLMDWLRSQSVPTDGFRDPGATIIGERIREIFLSSAYWTGLNAASMLTDRA